MNTLPNETNMPAVTPAVSPIMSGQVRPSSAHRISAIVAWLAVAVTIVGIVLASVSPSLATVAGSLIFIGFVALVVALIVFFVTRNATQSQRGQTKTRRTGGWGSSYNSVWDDDFGFLMVLLFIPLIIWAGFATLFRPQAQKTLERFLTTLSAGDLAGAQNLALSDYGLNVAAFAAGAPYISAYRSLSEVQIHDAQPGNPSAGKNVTGLAIFGEQGKAPFSALVAVTGSGWRVIKLNIAAPTK